MRLTIIAVLAALAVAGCKKKAPIEDKVVYVDGDDAAMNEAIAQARAHVDVFARELAGSSDDRLFAVKKAFSDSGGTEHMWLSDVKAVATGFEGRLENVPEKVTGVKKGERHTVTREELSDWLITDEQGRMWGGYTLRLVLPTLTPVERLQFEQRLQPLP